MTSKAQFIPFGKFMINRKDLEQNKLNLKYPNSKGRHPIFKKKTEISDDFKDLIYDILHTHKINIQTQKNLNDKEANMFHDLIHSCKLDVYLKYKRVTKDISDYVHRFTILHGAICAGNHARETLNEIRDVIQLLANPTINKIKTEDSKDLIDYIDYIDQEAYNKEIN